jgi:outer membrane protein insertion porin family
LRLRDGYIFGINDDVRITDRFFRGGATFRGFDEAGIGPRDVMTDDALGGNLYYLGTAELSFPLGLPEEFGILGSVFTEAGSLMDIDDSGPFIEDEGSLRASVGVGVFWESPFGPIRLDFAHAVRKEEYDETQFFRFNIGTRF